MNKRVLWVVEFREMKRGWAPVINRVFALRSEARESKKNCERVYGANQFRIVRYIAEE